MYKSIFLKIKYLLLFCLISSSNLFSQTVSGNTERNYYINVKQFNEFVDRFNYKTDFKANKIDSSFKSKISREEYLKLLFNNKDPRIDINSDKYSVDYVKLKNEFINEVAVNNYLINKYSIKIIAEAKSQVIYKNKPTEVSIFLNQEIVNNGVKWVLLSAKADFLNVIKHDTVLLRFIPPTSNETNFISLKRVFEDTNYQHYYSYNGYTYDPLSAFLFAVNTGLVKFKYVNKIVYHVFDINAWQFEITEFIRDTENSGWLITDISKNSNSFTKSLEKIIKY